VFVKIERTLHQIVWYCTVVSAGGRLTINASPPGWSLRSVAEWEQFGCDQG
jgi:hypothetical protein